MSWVAVHYSVEGEKSKYEKFINTSKCGNDILVE
jgi:hypothetical protein